MNADDFPTLNTKFSAYKIRIAKLESDLSVTSPSYNSSLLLVLKNNVYGSLFVSTGYILLPANLLLIEYFRSDNELYCTLAQIVDSGRLRPRSCVGRDRLMGLLGAKWGLRM